jgi:uncharacterized protein
MPKQIIITGRSLATTIALVAVCGCERASSQQPEVPAHSAPGAAGATACAIPPVLVENRESDTNINGGPLAACGAAPLTGYFRNGKCSTGAQDSGVHVICARVTDAFLNYSKSKGNDLVSPHGGFPGLHAGDQWCLCAARWEEARAAQVAPPVVGSATHIAALRTVRAADLQANSVVE